MSKIDASPDHYIFLCARRYAETLKELRSETSDDGRLQHTKLLHYLMDSGSIEADRERSRRIERLPTDIQILVEDSKQLTSCRLITKEEAELIRDFYSVPPFATIDTLSAVEMVGLADMYEGWAQDRRIDSFNMSRLLGWADGYRALAEEIGPTYEPPAKVSGETNSLTKFLANQMRQ